MNRVAMFLPRQLGQHLPQNDQATTHGERNSAADYGSQQMRGVVEAIFTIRLYAVLLFHAVVFTQHSITRLFF
jgi:hypothetical protein